MRESPGRRKGEAGVTLLGVELPLLLP
jgi:hypothetical protein